MWLPVTLGCRLQIMTESSDLRWWTTPRLAGQVLTWKYFLNEYWTLSMSKTKLMLCSRLLRHPIKTTIRAHQWRRNRKIAFCSIKTTASAVLARNVNLHIDVMSAGHTAPMGLATVKRKGILAPLMVNKYQLLRPLNKFMQLFISDERESIYTKFYFNVLTTVTI